MSGTESSSASVSETGEGGSPEYLSASIRNLYDRLLEFYGPQSWWPSNTELEMILGAVLVQNTSWINARKALDALSDAGILTPSALIAVQEIELAGLIRASRYFNGKARTLKAFAQMLKDETDGDLEILLAKPLTELRPLLLSTHGFGQETADAICLYAARYPTFVIDTYTRRILSRLGFVADNLPYQQLQKIFFKALPKYVSIYAEYHALFVVHAKRMCTKAPICHACPLLDLCPKGKMETGLMVSMVN